ncbi:hypothetical protein VTL71DRAFT_11298 [Oculimacula yallundae]|uniref:Uncharacterized protein n=1 Tax=Oculimacula yallundae TaxID=86028 RepID=A0ABR4CPU8_9HELO
MDFLKKGADMLNKNKASGSGQPAQGGAAPVAGQPAAGQKDYGDKAFDFISKKTGHNMDPNTSEKITDGARGLYEKQTGYVLFSLHNPNILTLCRVLEAKLMPSTPTNRMGLQEEGRS